jgi:Uma2 family endonuclease
MADGTKQYTVEEFDRFVDLPENADKLFELIGGEIVEVPSNPYVSEIASNISFFLKLYLRERGIEGHVTGEAGGYRVFGERYAPDVAFIAKARQPELARQGYNPNPPDLAVEVLSPSYDPERMRIKLVNYLRAGATVWIVNPDKQQVEVYTPGETPVIVNRDGALDGGAVLPGFTLAAKDVFPE